MNNNNGFNRSSTKIGFFCKNCTDRYLGCHDHCDKYQNQVKERNEHREQIAKAKAVDVDYQSFKVERIRATKKEISYKKR